MMELTPFEYLMIDVANHMGLDKEAYETRLAWVDDNIDKLEMHTDSADKPELYLAAVMALRDTQAGRPTGHLVGFDAAASGLQIMAAITGCRTTAKNTGLIGDQRADMYRTCTDTMSRMLGADVDVPRKLVKSAQMPYFYGSKKKPKEVFGEETEEYYAFHEANRTVAPNACELLEDLLLSWQAYNLSHSWYMPDGFFAYIPVMIQDESRVEIDELGSTVTYAYKVNAGQETGLSNAANVIHSIDGMVVRELVRRCSYNVRKITKVKILIESVLPWDIEPKKEHRLVKLWRDSDFVSLAAVDHITDNNIHQFPSEFLAYLLDKINFYLQRPSFDVVTVHDEFKCHANYMKWVRLTYREIMAELAQSQILKAIVSQIYGMDVELEFPNNHPDLHEEIMQGTYAIT